MSFRIVRLRRPHRGTAIAIATLVGVASAGLFQFAASAAAGCVYDSGSQTVNIGMTNDTDAAVVTRDGPGQIVVNGSVCTGGATVFNTDTISVTGGAGGQTLTIDLSNGPFEPGADFEAVGQKAEIEWEVDLGPNGVTSDSVIVLGSPDADNLVMGQSTSTEAGTGLFIYTTGINLNGDNDYDVFDVGRDGTAGGTPPKEYSPSVDSYVLVGRGGNDTLSARGGIEAGFGPITKTTNTLRPGAGDDVALCGESAPATPSSDTQATSPDIVDFADAPVGVLVDLNFITAQSTGAGNDRIQFCERVTGSAFNDTLRGNAVANRIAGLAGDDVLHGRGGDDVYSGGDGADWLDYSTAAEGLLIDLLVVQDENGDYGRISEINTANAATEGSDETVRDVENVIATNFNDILNGDENDNVLLGLAGNDVIDGDVGDDRLVPGPGTDGVTGGTNGSGLAGDTVDYSPQSVIAGAPVESPRTFPGALGNLTINLPLGTASSTNAADGNDTLATIENAIGSNQNDVITGTDSANRLEGRAGNDTFDGNEGSDVIVPGAGDDQIAGGGGTDTLDYSGAPVGVTVDLALVGPQATGEGSDNILGVENLTGSAFADVLRGGATANTLVGGLGDDLLNGRGGNDTLTGGDGIDTATFENATSGVTINLGAPGGVQPSGGGDGNDTITGVENLIGSPFNDTLTGDGNANTIEGTAGNDTMDGSGGVDLLSYASAPSGVVVDLSAGTATGGAGSDTLANFENVLGSASNDTLTGNDAANSLSGSGGNDTMDGKLGADTFDGGAGVDEVSYASRTATVVATIGNLGGNGESGENDSILSTVENLTGGKGNDTLTGDAAGNLLIGGAGNDVLSGGLGDDFEFGGEGNDRFAQMASFNGNDYLHGGPGTDTVDYTQRPTIPVNEDTLISIESVTGTTASGTGGTPAPAQTPAQTPAPTNNQANSPQGYSLVGEDGSLYAFGTAKNVGDMKGQALNAPIIGVAYTPGGSGYWLVAKDGGIFTFGNADFYGSMGGTKLNSPVIGMAATPTGKGYWLFAGDGGIFTFGDAVFFGSMGDQKLNAPVINMEPLESGNGYWLVAGDGGIFTFGKAEFYGSMGDQRINQPVFDMTSTDTDKGYWLVARDGGIFSFGDAEAKFFGSAVNETPQPTKVIGMDSTPGALGYWIADATGKVYEYGNAQELGDRFGQPNPAPMIGFASVPGVKA